MARLVSVVSSLLVGSALLLAQPATALAQADRASELQRLVDDLGYQLQQAQQQDEREAQRRLRQLAIALDRWNHSGRSQDSFRTMQQWLIDSIQSSLPGQPTPMPELPWFGQRVVVESPQRSEAVSTPPPAAKHESEPSKSASQVALAPREEMAPKASPAKAVAALLEEHPASQPIDLGDPFVDDEPQSPAPAAKRIAMRPMAVSMAQPASRVDVNVAELGARIRGYVHGLRAVEARLMASGDFAADDLARVIRELRELAGQRELVTMYLGALTPEAAARTPELPVPSHAKAMAAEHIDRIRSAGENRAAADTLQAMLDAI